MTQRKILVTGGAGYIGSHITKSLLSAGYSVIALDNLAGCTLSAIETLQKEYDGLEFIKGDITNREELADVLKNKNIETVIHLAAKIDAAESVKKPQLYEEVNFRGSVILLETISALGIKNFIFASTAAVYGNPQYLPVDEDHPTIPANPYGETKLDFEKYLALAKNLNWLVLRFFNVAGSDRDGKIGKGDRGEKNFIDNLVAAIENKELVLEIFGDDYQTEDGTTIRDFIHVDDIARATTVSLAKIPNWNRQIINLGSGRGQSLREVISKAEKFLGIEIPTKVGPRRQGDISVSYCNPLRASQVLSWEPKYSEIENILKTELSWRKKGR